jgi:hypothetical protein
MSTVANMMTHARAFLGVSSTYASAEEVRIANTVNGIIGNYARWHWNTSACTNISLTADTSDYTMNAADQNTVLAIEQAYLSDASLTYPPMSLENNTLLPALSATGRPFAVGLLSSTQVRVFPTPNSTFTLHWRKYKRPTVFTANTESFDTPSAFDACVKQGMIWQIYVLQDDARAPDTEKTFMGLLEALAATESLSKGRRR